MDIVTRRAIHPVIVIVFLVIAAANAHAKSAEQSSADRPTEWLARSRDDICYWLGRYYYAAAEELLMQNQPSQAIYYFELVRRVSPKSKYAKRASVRLEFLQAQPTRGRGFGVAP
jgi:hypothetical protein